MKQDLIDYVNKNCPLGQGIDNDPFFLYKHEDYVLYSQYEEGKKQVNHLKALDILLDKLYPSISCLEFRAVERLIETTVYNDHNYHRSFNMIVEYIKLDKLTELIAEFKNKNI